MAENTPFRHFYGTWVRIDSHVATDPAPPPPPPPPGLLLNRGVDPGGQSMGRISIYNEERQTLS